ncbi:hypothetical protein SAMN04489723_1127 [Algoriphagus aquimarinus]|uniref:Uncharacterized protein n=1 Tax=Algoriphagus aquimarinus TaxID=237018 RepID=A0A1I1BF12_9BACT|nr:hypothetical protein SAMN04489723_1127 [Algoriphagus aquimarinus]
MVLVWAILILTPLLTLGSQAKSPSKPEASYSIESTPALTGDTNLCIVINGIIGNYSAGGDSGDVYEWTITNSSGEILFNRSGGDQYASIQFLFTEVGEHIVSLKIRRGTDSNFYQETLKVKVQKGPNLALKPDYLLCGDTPVLLTALDPTTPSISEYTIIWKTLDENGSEVPIGTGNEFLTSSAGYHFVELYFTNPDGTQACTIEGSTFVGPPIDYKITQSTEQICEGESIAIGTDTPLTGEWFIRKAGTSTKTSLGNAFDISIKSSQLNGPGEYEVFFSAEDTKYPDCPSERKILFELLEAPVLDVQILVSPDDCISTNGSFQITSNTDLATLEIPELGVIEGPVSSGQTFVYSNLDPKVYSIIVSQGGCKITQLVQLDIKNPPITPSPPIQFIPSITTSPETCSTIGVSKGKVLVDFGQTIGTGEYRVLSTSKGEISTGSIPSNGLFQSELSAGKYILELMVDGCNYPFESFTIAEQSEVEYNIPENFLICESFQFTPETQEDLLFTLTYPDGSKQSLRAGAPFLLTSEGKYTLNGEDRNSSSGLCSKVENFEVTLSSKITFAPIHVEDGCFKPIQYTADIQGLTADETSIRWLNSHGDIVGRSLEFYPAEVGFYSLLVQPLASGFCDVAPVVFEVVPPVTSVPMELEATIICPEPGTSLVTLITDEEEVLEIEWIFYDLNDQRKELTEFNNLFEIEVSEAGTYEAVAYNKLHCEIGRNLILVKESTLLTLPNLDESYPMCSKENTMAPIDPGEYAKYEWYFGNQLVSSERLFNPTQVGDYQLLVTTEDGCVFEDNFRTYDVCNYQIVYPNAMVLEDTERDFRVLLSEGVTDAELFILNRQGELIFHAATGEIPIATPVLRWDGKLNGKWVPTGTYVVVIILRNSVYGFEEKEIGSLTVLD